MAPDENASPVDPGNDPEVERLRMEVETLRGQLGASAASNGGQVWRRRWLSVTSAVVGAVLLPVGVATVWARNTMLDTDQYVATVAPLSRDENVQEAVGFRVSEAVAEAADFRAIAEETLPEEARLLAGPIEAGAKDLIAEVAQGLVATPEFADLWEGANRVAHESLVPLLTGDSDGTIAAESGRVVVRLQPVAEEVVGRLDERLGTSLMDQIPAQELDAEVVVVESRDLADAQSAIRWFDRLSWFSLILAVAFLAGAVLFSENRRWGVRRLGVGVVAPMLLAIVAYALVRNRYLDGLPDDVHNPQAAAAIFDILTEFLFRAFRTLLVLGLLIVLGAWVVGPSTTAARVRTGWDTLLGRAGVAGAGGETGAVPPAVAAHERALLIAAVALGALVLVLWPNPTGVVVLLVAAVTAVASGVIRVVAEVGRRSDGLPATGHATAGRPVVDAEVVGRSGSSGGDHDQQTQEPDATASGR